jgi:alpha-L-rhamnosidase
MEKISTVLGKKEEAQMYTSRKQNITELINNELFDKTNKSYGSGIQVDLTYPLLAGIVPDILKESVTTKLKDVIINEHNGHIATGLVGIPVFTEWCTENREADLMYSMLKKRDYPGYLYMIDNGATTTWEHWNGARSRIHNCYNGIGSWFYQSVGGIKKYVEAPAYKSVIIDPDIPAGITWANTTKDTPYGTVTVKWNLENGVFRMNIGIPVGCTARIVIPENADKLTLNGKKIEKESSFLETGSGEYKLMYEIIAENGR